MVQTYSIEVCILEHFCKKIAILSCYICLISNNAENMNSI
jgi:hypothetical protein